MPLTPSAPLPSLASLRQEIDRIDDALHDLLMARAALAAHVAQAKGHAASTAMIRPAREVAILKRLLTRHHGPFPKTTVMRLWREIIAAMTSLEAPLRVAVYMPTRGAGYLELARDHFGAYTTTMPHDTPRAVIAAVQAGTATVGVLPLPDGAATGRWWRALVTLENPPQVVFRLPLLGPGQGRGDGIEALVIAQATTGTTTETTTGASRDDVTLVVSRSPLPDPLDSDDDGYHVAEVAGLVAAADSALTVLGAYTPSHVLKELL